MIKLEQIDSCVLVLAKNYFKTEYLSDYNLRSEPGACRRVEEQQRSYSFKLIFSN